MRSKRLMALTMAVVLSVSTLSVPAKAQETTQEYVVVVENEKGQDIIESDYEEVDSLQSEKLNDMAVVEMTESEAKKLEDNKNIALVEENITFEASDSKKKKSKSKKKEKKNNKNEEFEMKMLYKQMRAENTCQLMLMNNGT